jgi:hypothetical protein
MQRRSSTMQEMRPVTIRIALFLIRSTTRLGRRRISNLYPRLSHFINLGRLDNFIIAILQFSKQQPLEYARKKQFVCNDWYASYPWIFRNSAIGIFLLRLSTLKWIKWKWKVTSATIFPLPVPLYYPFSQNFLLGKVKHSFISAEGWQQQIWHKNLIGFLENWNEGRRDKIDFHLDKR